MIVVHPIIDTGLVVGLATSSIVLGEIHSVPAAILYAIQCGAGIAAILVCLKTFFGVDFKIIRKFINEINSRKKDKD